MSDMASINIEFDAVDSSPGLKKRGEEITVESLKKMLADDGTANKAEEERQRREVVNMFRSAPFEEIVARSEAKSNQFHSKLAEILDLVCVDKLPSEPPAQEMVFPKLFVY